ncbi:PadR family transcriptional regulator [Humibacter sp. BT305]|nr:PadR family transcriptional regulator [Humibacter sp. BT305]
MAELTTLAVAALSLLVEAPMHPYEMFQTMTLRRTDQLVKVRPGSLYHTVARLERDGYAREMGTSREGNRPERTTYEVTESGREALRERLTAMLASPVPAYPEFALALAEAHNLPLDEVRSLLERRVGSLRAELEDVGIGVGAVLAKDLPRRFWIEAQYRRTLLESEIDWIDSLLSDLADGSLPWD